MRGIEALLGANQASTGFDWRDFESQFASEAAFGQAAADAYGTGGMPSAGPALSSTSDTQEKIQEGLGGLGLFLENLAPVLNPTKTPYRNVQRAIPVTRPNENPGLQGLASLLSRGAGLGLGSGY